MAVTWATEADPQTIEIWGKKLGIEFEKKSFLKRFVGDSVQSLIYHQKDTQRAAGSKVNVTLLGLLQQAPILGDGTLEGNEEGTQSFVDSFLIDEFNWVEEIPAPATISHQREGNITRQVAMELLSIKLAEDFDRIGFNHLCGYTAESTPGYIGPNSVLAPSSGRQMWAGTATNDQGLGSNDVFTLELLDRAITDAKVKGSSGQFRIRPVAIPELDSRGRIVGNYGDAQYICFIHPVHTEQLRSSSSSTRWREIYDAALMGREITNNPIFKGGHVVGLYNGVLLVESESVTQGVNSSSGAAISTVRRAVLCGAQSLAIAYGMATSNGRIKWTESPKDYGRRVGFNARMIMGMKKCRYNSMDYATIVISTYARSV